MPFTRCLSTRVPRGAWGHERSGSDQPRATAGEMLTLDMLLAELRQRPSWQREAACRNHPELDFFSRDPVDIGRARALCAQCPVGGPCWAYATAHSMQHGVWSGVALDPPHSRSRAA